MNEPTRPAHPPVCNECFDKRHCEARAQADRWCAEADADADAGASAWDRISLGAALTVIAAFVIAVLVVGVVLGIEVAR